MKIFRSLRRKCFEADDVNVGDLVVKTRQKHRLMAVIFEEINNLVVLNKKSTDSISEVLKSLLHYLNSNTTGSIIFPLIHDLENAHFELTDTLNKLLPEPIIKQMVKYKHLEPQLKELESTAHRVNRHKRNLNQSYSRSRSTVKKEKAHINYRTSSMNYDYLTNCLMDKMNTVENEGTMACCDALFVLVSTYKQFSDRIYSILNYLFEEVNKLHECAARELNMSYAKSLKNMENATQATKWKASSIMSCQDREGSICRSSSRGRIISSNFDSSDRQAIENTEHDSLSVTELSSELLGIITRQKSSDETIGSNHSYHCLNKKSSSNSSSLTLPLPPPPSLQPPSSKAYIKTMVTNTTNESQSKESLPQKDTNGALCKISSSQSSQSSTSLSTTKSNEIIDSNDHENSNDTTTLNSVSIQMAKVDDTNNPDMKSGNGDDINSDKTNNDNSGNKEKCTLTNNLLFNSTSSASTYSICQFPYYSNQKSHHYNQNYPYDIKSPTVSTIYSIRNNNPSSSILTEKTETLLPIMKSSNVCNMNYATEKSLSSVLYLNKNNMNPLSDSCLYDNNNEISCIPIIVQKNSWSNTSPINNNDNNKNSNSSNHSTREFGSDAINSNDNHRTLYRESLLNDNEVRPPKQNIISWGCLPSPITEEEDE
ncbi:hypothetical protein MS3_00005657 [Schistosoma haematobium]|uniref:Uncharacterized protein n=1 Tax=Schistosoma haematobium TaxID=6185 RepID=A0A922LKZ1_SCHHA|nr:hypothetical protein MS3_00005657 [Schistosoma haematobium]KAH9588179.1 hypothetical protein MS3_00005657 [Schistosoma haematobium]CAH8560608.1 unnamed protein product [Schistosoma haematobium]